MTPHQHQIMSMYLSGMSGTAIASALGLNPSTVYAHLRNPVIKAAMVERLKQLDVAIVDWKIKAIEAAGPALDKIINLSQHAKDEKLQRDASMDVIRLAGLEPQKRVIVQGDVLNGIDKQTVEYIDTVAAEIEEFSKSE